MGGSPSIPPVRYSPPPPDELDRSLVEARRRIRSRVAGASVLTSAAGAEGTPVLGIPGLLGRKLSRNPLSGALRSRIARSIGIRTQGAAGAGGGGGLSGGGSSGGGGGTGGGVRGGMGGAQY